MTRFSFRMWRSKHSKILLAEVLQAISDNDWVWSILEFDGIGPTPNGTHPDEFDEWLRAHPAGYLLTWAELQAFASHLEDVHFFLAVAVTSIDRLNGERLAQDDFSGCVAVLEAFDSTEWTVSFEDAQAFQSALFVR